MNFNVLISENVFEELTEAAEYYEERQEGLGLSFFDDWENTLNQLKNSPRSYQEV